MSVGGGVCVCVLVRVRCCSKRYTVTLGKPPYRRLAFLACNGSIANRYSVYRKTPYGRLIGAVTVRNGKRYAGQLPAVEPIVGLGDVAGVEQLVDPEVDRLLGSASIPVGGRLSGDNVLYPTHMVWFSDIPLCAI